MSAGSFVMYLLIHATMTLPFGSLDITTQSEEPDGALTTSPFCSTLCPTFSCKFMQSPLVVTGSYIYREKKFK